MNDEKNVIKKMKQEKSKRVLLGMSGGVDSSVAAVLLQNQGYEVVGATMVLWNNPDSTTVEDAKKVCDKLGIEHIVIHCEKEFQTHVIDDFICCYKCAKTPNPCVECNKYLKFGVFFEKAQELGCDYIATGHYAKIEWSEKYGQYVLKKADAEAKDQSYFLYGIKPEALEKVLFPLANYTDKTEIRKIAEEYDLPVAQKKDSQEVCFIPDNDYVKFLEGRKSNTKTGNIVLQDGTILGQHKGLIYYTVGQRKGLGIAYKEPLYVLKLDKNKNEVVVGNENQLYAKILQADELNFLIKNIDLSKPIEVMAKIRYRSKPAKAVLNVKLEKMEDSKKDELDITDEKDTKMQMIAKLTFEEPQRAITPGQSVVFYIDNGIVLGGGKIL